MSRCPMGARVQSRGVAGRPLRHDISEHDIGEPGMSDDEFLVRYEYGMGGPWAVLIEPSEAAIRSK